MNKKQAFNFLSKNRHSGQARQRATRNPWAPGGARGDEIKNIKYLLDELPERVPLWKLWLIRRQLRRGMPVSKIIGRKWFYGLEFSTGAATLDPRPDSETLVEAAIRAARPGVRILDLGTGTGALICALVKNIPGASGVGIDRSRAALRVARKNVHRLGLDDNVSICKGSFINHKINQKFDIIVSNPPYIATGDARVDRSAKFDPKIALYAGADGLKFYREIAIAARGLMAENGKIFLEIGADAGAAVREIFAAAGWRFVSGSNDLAGLERVLEFMQ
ncbi:MAG: peptide chain release factor N(5)-glutamine methyltransferase [Rickettsiales bacterium]|nr:peptide chain release factor N(5)-glutamine methyltransferase [Rickettsiales bacterium]